MKLIWIFLKKIFNYIIQYNENGGFELEYLPINIKKLLATKFILFINCKYNRVTISRVYHNKKKKYYWIHESHLNFF